MIRLLASVVLLLVVAVLVVLNAQHMTPFNLFGYNIESVPVIGIALISFAVGVLYSFILYAMHYVHKNRKRKLSTREGEVKRYKQEQKKSQKKAQEGGSNAALAAPAQSQSASAEEGAAGHGAGSTSRSSGSAGEAGHSSGSRGSPPKRKRKLRDRLSGSA